MEGIKEKQELSNEFNHSVKNEIKKQELGFQSLDFADQTLDHQLQGDQDDGLTKKLSEMTIEGLSGEEEGSELVFAIELDDEKRETEGGFDKDGNFGGEIGGENDQGGFGGFKDSGGEDEGKIEEREPDKWSVVEGNEGDFEGVKEGGGDELGSKLRENEKRVGDRDWEVFINDEAKIDERKRGKFGVVEGNEGDFEGVKEGGGDDLGSKLCENENRVGDRDLEGFINDEAKIEERSGKFIVVEGTDDDFKEKKERGKDKEGSKWSEIENEGGDRDLEGIKDEAEIEVRNPEKRSVVEGNEGDFKEMKEGGNDKEGSKWSEIENEGGDRDLKGINNEAEIKERNPEKRSVVEENEGNFKEMKDGGNDKEGSKWGESEDVEESYNLEVKNKRVGKGKEVIEDYEDGWGQNWDDSAVRAEANQGQQYFDNYENERNVNEQYGEVPQWCGNAEGDVVGRNGKAQYDKETHWYGTAEKDSLGLNDGNFESYQYPLRSNAEDCSFYMRTGTCKFGSNCKFNHPLERKNQAARVAFKQKEEVYDKPRQTECKYYLSSGGCKYGKACRYNHGKGKAAVTPNPELNFLGLPIRVGEKECPFYMRTGSCKYGSNCRFHHPEPTVAGGGDTTSPGRGSSSARTLNETAPFRPVIYPPTPSVPPNAEWNGYQAPAYQTSQWNLPIPPALSMNIPATGSSLYANPRGQVTVDEYPERPGQPECSFYMKTGDCKYKSSCKFHHPKNPETSVTLSDQGLPLRPGQSVCSHFSRYGICKFGPSCKYDHSIGGTAASSDGSDQGRPLQFTCFADEYGKWETEPMGSA